MKGQRARGRSGLFDPELAEQGKFLARLVPGPNRKTASGDAEGLGVRPRPIEVRALKDRHVFVALLGRLENAQPGKAEVAQNRGVLQLAKVEVGRLVDHLLRHAVLDDIDRDRRRIDKAPMQRLKRKAEFLVAPDRGSRNPPDRRILLKGETGKHARQRGFRRLERFRGEFDRHLHDRVGGEWNRLAERFGGGGRRAGRGQRSRERPANRQLQEFATLPVRHRILRSLAAEPDRTKTARLGVVPSQNDKSASEEKTTPQARRVPSLARWLYIVFCDAARRILRPAAKRRRLLWLCGWKPGSAAAILRRPG